MFLSLFGLYSDSPRPCLLKAFLEAVLVTMHPPVAAKSGILDDGIDLSLSYTFVVGLQKIKKRCTHPYTPSSNPFPHANIVPIAPLRISP